MNRTQEIINDLESKGIVSEQHDCNYDGHCTYCLRGLRAAERLEKIKQNA